MLWGRLEHSGADGERQRLGGEPVGVAGARLGKLRSFMTIRATPPPSMGEHTVLAGLGVPQRDQLDELVPALGGEVVVLREVLRDVVQLPVAGVQVTQRLSRD